MKLERMVFERIFLWLVLSLVFNGGWVVESLSKCQFPAIYNFGDSNSDTGGISAAFMQTPPPNGESFFRKPTGRVCDGRLLIDFTAENLDLPYLSAYLDSIGTNFRHGANFATGGSTIRPSNLSLFVGGISPFSLDVQLWQFTQFRTRTIELYNRENSIRAEIPRPDEFSKALYTLDIGQNDLAAGFRTMSDDQVRASIPDILLQFSQAIQNLYGQGARAFWIHNTGPIGCLPFSVIYYPFKPNNLDQVGCVRPQNEIAQEFNKQLKEKVNILREQLPLAAFTYVDVYSAKYSLITEAKKQGFTDPLKFCCGQTKDYSVGCGKKAVVNGSEVYGASCGNPSMYVSWDGIHYSQSANQWIANRILSGLLSDPPLAITEACHRQAHN